MQQVRVNNKCCRGFAVVLETKAEQQATRGGYAYFGRWQAYEGEMATCERCGGVFEVAFDYGGAYLSRLLAGREAASA